VFIDVDVSFFLIFHLTFLVFSAIILTEGTSKKNLTKILRLYHK